MPLKSGQFEGKNAVENRKIRAETAVLKPKSGGRKREKTEKLPLLPSNRCIFEASTPIFRQQTQWAFRLTDSKRKLISPHLSISPAYAHQTTKARSNATRLLLRAFANGKFVCTPRLQAKSASGNHQYSARRWRYLR